MKLFVGLALLPLLANAITDNNYYSNSGGTSNTCSIVSCATEFTKCSNTGFYLFGCGKDPNDPNAAANNYASKGTCTACSNKPANSAYTSNASPLYTNTCSWTCNSGYAVSGTGASATCLTTTCPTPADSNADVSGTNPSCTYFCKPGYFGTADATTPNKCQPCSVGSYSASNGMTICTSCVAGKFGSGTGAANAESTCQNCPTGTYGLTDGASSSAGCTKCAQGKYSETAAASSATVCLNCGSGFFGIKQGGSSKADGCTACQAGTWSAATAADSLSTCTACIAGTYSGNTGVTTSDACVKCSAGSVSPSGASACTPCAAGTYAVGTGMPSPCTSCNVPMLALVPGMYLSNCGGSSSGTAMQCSN